MISKTNKLVRLMSIIGRMPEQQKQVLLSIYIMVGDEIFYILHMLRGQRFSFPSSRMYRKVARDLQQDEYVTVDSKASLFSESGTLLDIGKVFKGEQVIFQDETFVVESEPVRLCNTDFVVLKRTRSN